MKRIQFAFRAVARTPLVTLVVVLSLGLGIGANTAIFSLLYQIVLRSLPVERPEELVVLTSPAEFKNGRNSTDDAGDSNYIFSYPVVRRLEKNPQGVEGVAAFRSVAANLAFGNQTLSGSAHLVSGGYFRLLGARPLFGRTIAAEDDDGAGNPVVVLGYGYWKDRLGGDRSVLNQAVRVNGQVFTVVGVMPSNFTGTVLANEPDVYVPLAFKPQMTPGWDGRDKYDHYWLYVFARLKPGVTREQAEAALNTIYAGLVEEQAKVVRGRDAEQTKRFLQSRLTLKDGSQGQSSMRTDSRQPLFILMAATGLVLLIAIANAANLMLARSAQRRREMAIRAALGAGGGAIMGQLMTEALLLALAGGVAGVVLGYWCVHLLAAAMNNGEAQLYGITASLDWPILLFGFGIAVLSGLVFGLYPAWEAARNSVAGTLKDVSGQTTAGTASAKVRKALVCGQVAVSALLLIPTGLFLQSLVNLTRVDLGLRTENVITFGLSPSLNGYKPDQTRALFERLEGELAGIPGVRQVAVSMVPLIAGSNWGNNLTVEGYPTDDRERDATNSMLNVVGPGFFSTMGIPLIAGREFTERDTPAGPKVAVVNETFARHFFGDKNPIGRKFAPGAGNDVKPNIEIVGVVKDSNYSSVKQKVPKLYFTPYRQDQEINASHFYVRTALAPLQVMPQIRKVIGGVDRDLPVEDLRTFADQIKMNVRSDRLVFQLAGAFAALATILAMLGLYGVMAYSVARRTREIGIRLALGAGTGGIRSMVMREMLIILGAGVAAGVPIALMLTRFTESQLFGVKAYDAGVVAIAILALALAALAAGYLPARRATRVNPVEALRYE